VHRTDGQTDVKKLVS